MPDDSSMGGSGGGECPHSRKKFRKRALDKTGWPDAWSDAIIEECLDCGAIIFDHKGVVKVVA